MYFLHFICGVSLRPGLTLYSFRGNGFFTVCCLKCYHFRISWSQIYSKFLNFFSVYFLYKIHRFPVWHETRWQANMKSYLGSSKLLCQFFPVHELNEKVSCLIPHHLGWACLVFTIARIWELVVWAAFRLQPWVGWSLVLCLISCPRSLGFLEFLKRMLA